MPSLSSSQKEAGAGARARGGSGPATGPSSLSQGLLPLPPGNVTAPSGAGLKESILHTPCPAVLGLPGESRAPSPTGYTHLPRTLRHPSSLASSSCGASPGALRAARSGSPSPRERSRGRGARGPCQCHCPLHHRSRAAAEPAQQKAVSEQISGLGAEADPGLGRSPAPARPSAAGMSPRCALPGSHASNLLCYLSATSP